jgi:LacI family transcriptional regulator/LacI family repressor for deo operon, udp, cdd, tsx, nupC, and nupG
VLGGEVVTIADVAAKAGVGAGTVSRVLNGSPRVAPPTRERVEAAIEALGYRPNPLARGLSRGRCQTIGVIVPFFTHASAVERLRGVVAALADSGYDLVLFNVESALHRDEHLNLLRSRAQADGVLVMSLSPPEEEVARLVGAGMRVVLVDARAPGVPAVVTDDVEGGRIATAHLTALGHRRIAFIGEAPENELGASSSTDREVGYGEVLASAGIAADPSLVVHGAHDRDVARALALDLLDRRDRPTAVFAASDVQAMGVRTAAEDLGLVVPRDLSGVGFDDIELARYVGLTTVRQPLFESGQLGAELLLDALAGDEPQHARAEVLPLALVERATTAPPREVGP